MTGAIGMKSTAGPYGPTKYLIKTSPIPLPWRWPYEKVEGYYYCMYYVVIHTSIDSLLYEYYSTNFYAREKPGSYAPYKIACASQRDACRANWQWSLVAPGNTSRAKYGAVVISVLCQYRSLAGWFFSKSAWWTCAKARLDLMAHDLDLARRHALLKANGYRVEVSKESWTSTEKKAWLQCQRSVPTLWLAFFFATLPSWGVAFPGCLSFFVKKLYIWGCSKKSVE